MVVGKMVNKELERKLKIENLTRCMNCVGFVSCKEEMKEEIVDCDRFIELSDSEQVVVVKLKESCEKAAIAD